MDKSKSAQQALNEAQNNNITTVAIIIALAVGLLTLLILLLRRRSAKRRNVLLLGLCDSGKTTIFCKLAHGKQGVSTFTSMKENTGAYHPENRNASMNIVDIPGHDRLRINIFNQYKSVARGIIYVIDSNTLPKEIKDVAEFLHSVVTDKVIIQNKVPILVTCHKQDSSIKSKDEIQSQLEKEMDTVIMTQSAQLDSTGSLDKGSRRSVQKGRKQENFQFSDMLPIKIEFAESRLQEGVDVDGIKQWLEKIA